MTLGAQRIMLYSVAAKKKSGFVTEEQRKTERLTLRLDPESMRYLRHCASEYGWTVAETVKAALAALEREDKTDAEVAIERLEETTRA